MNITTKLYEALRNVEYWLPESVCCDMPSIEGKCCGRPHTPRKTALDAIAAYESQPPIDERAEFEKWMAEKHPRVTLTTYGALYIDERAQAAHIAWQARAALAPAVVKQDLTTEPHPDDVAVDSFAVAMKAKMAVSREKGRGGWDDPEACTSNELARGLAFHLRKSNAGNYVDLANFCMMLHLRGTAPSMLPDVLAEHDAFMAAQVERVSNSYTLPECAVRTHVATVSHDCVGHVGIHDPGALLALPDGTPLYALAPPSGDAPKADLPVQIAAELARIDGYDVEDREGGLYDLRWSGGPNPEPEGDAWSMDYLPKGERIARAIAAPPADAPIPMLLYCPACGMQHVDAPEPRYADNGEDDTEWTNPPHRSHLCAGCGHIWRPADVATTGVVAIATRGQRDGSPVPVAPVPSVLQLPADGAYIIRYDDTDEPDEFFAKARARDAAIKRYAERSLNWNAHLYVKIDSNCRDAESYCPSAKFVATADALDAEVEAARRELRQAGIECSRYSLSGADAKELRAATIDRAMGATGDTQ